MENSETENSTKLPAAWMLAGLLALAIFATGTALWASGNLPFGRLPDLLGAAPRPLPPGGLNVQDVAADPKGFSGPVTVRGVVARFAPNDPTHPTLFALVDSREARACKSTGCGSFYLPVKADGPPPKQWDELDVRGTLTDTPQMFYIKATQVENFGSIR
ncbi:MAG: hypothetical protein M1547_03670 [Gammaproteobacteria bacterium]|nr:hypothetical protein [Gammaproteobacteria bacterium]